MSYYSLFLSQKLPASYFLQGICYYSACVSLIQVQTVHCAQPYSCQLFLRQMREIFVLQSVRVSEDDPTTVYFRRFSETFEEVWKNSEVLSFMMHLGSTEDQRTIS